MPTRHPAFTHAIVMGDLVHSEQASSVEKLHTEFNGAVKRANKRMAGDIASPLTITLGDEFQGLTRTVSGSLRVVQAMRHLLLERNIACRFVIGLVRVETPVNNKNAWNMMGPGLARARERLSDKRDPNAYRFSFPNDAVIERLLDAIGYSLTDIETGWTERQREIAMRALDEDLSSVQLATKFDVALRTFYKIRSAAKLEFYRNQWNALNVAASDLDSRYKLI